METSFGKKMRQAFTKVLAAGLAVFSVAPVVQNFTPQQVGAFETVEVKEAQTKKAVDTNNSNSRRGNRKAGTNKKANAGKSSFLAKLARLAKENPISSFVIPLLSITTAVGIKENRKIKQEKTLVEEERNVLKDELEGKNGTNEIGLRKKVQILDQKMLELKKHAKEEFSKPKFHDWKIDNSDVKTFFKSRNSEIENILLQDKLPDIGDTTDRENLSSEAKSIKNKIMNFASDIAFLTNVMGEYYRSIERSEPSMSDEKFLDLLNFLIEKIEIYMAKNKECVSRNYVETTFALNKNETKSSYSHIHI